MVDCHCANLSHQYEQLSMHDILVLKSIVYRETQCMLPVFQSLQHLYLKHVFTFWIFYQNLSRIIFPEHSSSTYYTLQFTITYIVVCLKFLHNGLFNCELIDFYITLLVQWNIDWGTHGILFKWNDFLWSGLALCF